MPHRSAIVSRFALGALALWVGLWPAGDALTGASRTVIVVETAPVPACPAHDEQPTPCDAGGCRDSSCEDDASPAACGGARSGRCGQCFCLGCLVLFAAAPIPIDPGLRILGTVDDTDRARISHHLQPPVPPPWADRRAIV